MRLLLDTHAVIWAAAMPNRLSARARAAFEDIDSEIVFSVVSLWEIVIKSALCKADFEHNAARLRLLLLEASFTELEVTGAHALGVAALPRLHSDPFDRLLVAQALAEGLTLATSDRALARYPVPLFSV